MNAAGLSDLQQRCLTAALQAGLLVPHGPSWFRAAPGVSSRRFHHRTVGSLKKLGLLASASPHGGKAVAPTRQAYKVRP